MGVLAIKTDGRTVNIGPPPGGPLSGEEEAETTNLEGSVLACRLEDQRVGAQ